MSDGFGGTQTFNLFSANDPTDQNFSYYAQSAKLPKFSIKRAKAAYYGIDFRVPTVITFDHSWTCKILLEQDMIIYEKLRDWYKLISDLSKNGGGIKTIPNINLRISLLNAEHTHFTTSYVLTGVWPNKIPELSLAYKADDNEAKMLDVEFKYQYCYKDDSFKSDDDPLNAANIWR